MRKILLTFLGIILILLIGVAGYTVYDKYLKDDLAEDKGNNTNSFLVVSEEQKGEIDTLLLMFDVDGNFIIDYSIIDQNNQFTVDNIPNNIRTYLGMINVPKEKLGITSLRVLETFTPPNDIADLFVSGSKVLDYRTENEMLMAIEALFGKGVLYEPENYLDSVSFDILYSSVSKVFFQTNNTDSLTTIDISCYNVYGDYNKEGDTFTFVQKIGFIHKEDTSSIYLSKEDAINKNADKSISNSSTEKEIIDFLPSYKFTYKKHANGDTYYFVSIDKI